MKALGRLRKIFPEAELWVVLVHNGQFDRRADVFFQFHDRAWAKPENRGDRECRVAEARGDRDGHIAKRIERLTGRPAEFMQ